MDILEKILLWLSQYVVGLCVVGAVISFIWSALRVTSDRHREMQFMEFETYHRLIKELVMPDPGSKKTWLHRQVVIVYELRNFPRYYDITLKVLRDLKAAWAVDTSDKWSLLITEINLTIAHIEHG